MSSSEFSSQLREFAAPIVSAAGAIIAPFRYFEAKSDLQQGLKPKPLTVADGLYKGIKAAPVIGGIIGTQLVVQEKIENALVGRVSKEPKRTPNLLQMLVSSVLVAAISAPLLAIFNGQTLGWGPNKSLQQLTLKQGGAIVGRETSFVLSQRVCEPAAAKMKEILGDNPGVQSASEFASGATGSVIGHPLDTKLTRLQASLPPARGVVQMSGGLTKAVGVGIFTVLYNRFKEFFQKR